MKRTITWIIIALLSGAVLAKIMFDKYEKVDIQKVINTNDRVYMLKYGTYKNLDDMTEKITNVDKYIYIESENKVTAYIGIFASRESATKFKDIYDKKGIKTSIEKVLVDNEEFIGNLNEYEKLLKAAEDENALMIIERQILACYSDLVAENE